MNVTVHILASKDTRDLLSDPYYPLRLHSTFTVRTYEFISDYHFSPTQLICPSLGLSVSDLEIPGLGIRGIRMWS